MTDININQFSESINNKADRDLGNLASPEGENRFINPTLTNSSYTTNRILEIPQDVKLEINSSNQLVLKAGSKVYIPNGFETDGTTPHFDVVTIESDIVNNNSHDGYHENFWLHWNRTVIATYPDVYNFSSPTQPTGSYTYAVWYDTANNVIKNTSNGGSTWYSGISLPVCRALGGSSNTVTSIDQIFNGFGFIGSTVFMLPNIKASLCNGLNETGTYKHVELATSTVLTTNNNYGGQNSQILLYNPDGTRLAITNTKYQYDAEINRIYCVSDHLNVLVPTAIVANFDYDTTGKILSLRPFAVDSVANSNASNFSQAGRSYLSGLGMPDITKGYLVSNDFATSTNFTAPCNGYFYFRAGWKTAGGMMVFLASVYNSSIYRPYAGGGFYYSSVGAAQSAWLPVKGGNKVQAQYNSNTDIAFDSSSGLWFIPAEGEN